MCTDSDAQEEELRGLVPCDSTAHISVIDVRHLRDFAIDFGDRTCFVPRGLRGPASIAPFSNGLYNPTEEG